jgi:Tfp pilus assembly protein PilO
MSRTQRWSGVTALLVVVIVVAGWFMMISPQRATASKLRSQDVTQQQANAKLQSDIQRLQAEVPGVAQAQEKIAAIAKQIPDTPSLASYVRAITQAAAETGVDLQTISPSLPAPIAVAAPVRTAAVPGASPGTTGTSGAKPSAAGATSAGTGTAAGLSTIAVSLTLAGDYFHISQFLKKLQDMSRATEVTAVNLAPGGSFVGSPAPASTWKVLNGTITLDIFMTNTPLAGAATSPSATPSH